MATQRKTGESRSASSGGRSGSSRVSGSGGRGKNTAKGRQQPAGQPFRREVGAVACLLLSVFSALGYFNMQALFISWFCSLLKGLLGFGFLLAPPALLLGAYILGFHRGRPVRLRLACALLLPLIFSCLIHAMLIEIGRASCRERVSG